MQSIYLDNAATSFPKPPAVADAMMQYLCEVGAPINRSVYAAAQKAELVTYSLRERLCRLFHFDAPDHVILTPGNTAALNMVLKGHLRPGDHCLVSAMEHNAVMRPLQQLAGQGVTFDRVPCDAMGFLHPEDIVPCIRPNTRLMVVAHASNVSGTVQDLNAVGAVCAQHGIPLVADAAQTAGHFPIDFAAAKLSALTVPGHKGLLGPAGIGALLVTPDFAETLTPLIAGGTGSLSDSEALPPFFPDRLEAGTANVPGIYGLEAALAFLEQTGIDAIRDHELMLTQQFLEGLRRISHVHLIGTEDLSRRVGVISLDFPGRDNGECAYALEQSFGILTRCGLHCAPAAHRTLGTYPRGTVRFSLSRYNTTAHVQAVLDALRQMAR